MRVVVTGASGFLGRRLVRALLSRGSLCGETVEQVTAFDTAPDGIPDGRVRAIAGDIADPAQIAGLIDEQTSAVFHLAAVVSGQAEQEFDLGMAVNVRAFEALLERIRAVAPTARLVTTSSVAVFGGALPAVVPDSQAWEPQSSYGMQKAVCDLLLAEYSRRGFVDGRSLRMPTIVVRPGTPNRAASSFASGIIREPVHGVGAACPVAAETALWVMSPGQAVRNILHGAELPAAALPRRVLNMPGLSVTVAAMLQALRRVCGDAAADRVRMQPDPAIQAIVGSWPGAFAAESARALGFTADADFEGIVRAFVAEA